MSKGFFVRQHLRNWSENLKEAVAVSKEKIQEFSRMQELHFTFLENLGGVFPDRSFLENFPGRKLGQRQPSRVFLSGAGVCRSRNLKHRDVQSQRQKGQLQQDKDKTSSLFKRLARLM